MHVCKRCFVSGRVQGVFYRASAVEKARQVHVTGYARNLSDGRVEVLVCGEEQSVKEFCDWLWQGSPAAKVSDVGVSDAECSEIPAVFSTR